MGHRLVRYVDRPELDDRWDETVGPAWPEFLLHGSVVNAFWHHLFEGDLAELQAFVVDEDTDEVLAVANMLSFSWDGEPATLPDGVDAVLQLAVSQRERGVTPTTACAMQAVVTVANRGKGLAAVVLEGMRGLAADHGFADLVAPVRPSWKDRYPLAPMERYASWTREDGLPFDPWIRQHVRAGATFEGIAARSQRIDGSVDEWSAWTGMHFPDSGAYVVPGALVPVEIDLEAGRGVLVEPNVWMRHRV